MGLGAPYAPKLRYCRKHQFGDTGANWISREVVLVFTMGDGKIRDTIKGVSARPCTRNKIRFIQMGSAIGKGSLSDGKSYVSNIRCGNKIRYDHNKDWSPK